MEEKFSARLRAAMGEFMLDVQGMASLLGTTQKQIRNWTKGHKPPCLTRQRAIEDLFTALRERRPTEQILRLIKTVQDKQHTSQICWDCKNACGGCSWSAAGHTPVQGWVATPIVIDGKIPSFDIKFCPEFVRDSYGGGARRT